MKETDREYQEVNAIPTRKGSTRVYEQHLEEEGVLRKDQFEVARDEENRKIIVSHLSYPENTSPTEIFKIARYSQFELSRNGNRLELEKYSIPRGRSSSGVFGEITRHREHGVFDIHLEAKREDGASVTVWYENESETGFAFWGLEARMPLENNPCHIPPLVMIRPGLRPGMIMYASPSMDERYLFSDAWEVESGIAIAGIDGIGLITEHLFFDHRFGAKERLSLASYKREGKQKLIIARLVDFGFVDEEGFRSYVLQLYQDLGMFNPTGLKLKFPSPFPKALASFESSLGESFIPNDEEAKLLMGKSQELEALLRGALMF